ncbi:hypothetical protein C8F04DRAFT_1321392 [Mycena alexandri]|uniref:Uncharacterized protein n=1 Tax=Mycena alexandri TaxID=1745969 RepID=A0AAD6WNR4_9AGAR|nr:hypothetical protein C8F04DRAFT_1321392 [Mycena alexandri]
MSSLSKLASALGSQLRPHQHSYAQVVHGQTMVVPDTEQGPRFSMAELNAGSVPLPRKQTHPVPLTLMSRGAVFSTVILNAGSAHTTNGWGRAVPQPIGSERRAICRGEGCHPQFLSHHAAMIPYCADRATSQLEDTRRPLHLEQTAPNDFALRYSPPASTSNDPVPTRTYPYLARASDFHPSNSRSPKYLTGGQTSRCSRREGNPTVAMAWQSLPPLSSPSSPLIYANIPTCPAVVPVVRRQKPRRRKYYGPFEACSREDVLPEFRDDAAYDHVEEQNAVDGQTWIEHLLTFTEREETSQEDDGWPEMERKTKARLLATYRKNSVSESPTGLRGLPIVVQVRPVYPAKMWQETVVNLEMKSEGY